MVDRIWEEITLIKKYYNNLEHDESRRWIIIHDYFLPKNMQWNKNVIDVCFIIPNGYPGTSPYGIYVSSDLRYDEEVPNNINPNLKDKPPFPGNWVLLSWTPTDRWNPNAEIQKGSNMLNFVRSFYDRFKSGR